MDKVKGSGTEQEISQEGEWLRNAEKAVPPFTYPPFTKAVIKPTIIVTCVLTVIIGLILLSVIMQFFPSYKVFAEAIKKETLTPEEEALADAATIKLLIYYGIGLVVLAGITVAAAFIAKKFKLKKALASYESAKQTAYEQWEKNKINLIDASLRERAREVCPFCGKKLTHVYDKGDDKSWYETVYDVSNLGGTTATLTPRSVKHEYIDLTNAFNRYSCTYCYFSIENRPLVNYSLVNYKTTIDIWKDSKIKYVEVEETLLYAVMKGSFSD